MPTTLITGCDYGIGCEFASQYAQAGWKVHAVCLQPDSEETLRRVQGDVVFHCLDVSDQAGLASRIGGRA
jgi:NAD(P)-dependent dehydrogenase (short-subunit alcohol dehydrogenase family)